MNRSRSKALAGAVALALGSTVVAGGLQAEESGLLEEITVTAQKREQSLSDVSLAVSAFSGDQAAELGFRQSTDIIAQVPGLTLTSPSGSAAFVLFNIRGVSQNDFAEHHESPIAVYEDEAYIASMQAAGFPLYDLERVEVLKGPQGTLFGRNATGGLIHYVTAKPSTAGVSGYARIAYGDFEKVELEGAVNLPIGERAAARLAAIRQRNDGYYVDLGDPNRHNQNVTAVRGQVLLDVNEDLEILLKGQYLQNDNERSGAYTEVPSFPSGEHGLGEVIGPNENPWGTCDGCDYFGFRRTSSDPLVNDPDFKGFFDREVYGGTATVRWKGDSVSVVSVTDYRKAAKDYAEDVESSPNPLIHAANFVFGVETLSQELRLGLETDRARWVAGLNYLNIDGSYGSKIWDSPVFTSFTAVDGYTYNTYGIWEHDKKAWSVFGQVDHDLTEKLTGILGLRYTNDKVEHSWQNVVGLDTYGYFNPPGSISEFTGEAHEDLLDFKAVLEYRPSDDWMVYGGLTQGSKGAGFTAAFSPDFADVIPFKSEQLRNYEVGAKGTMFGGTALLTGAVFYYDYKDYQAFVFDGLAQHVQNVDAVVSGAELELQAAPIAGLRLNLGAAFLFEAKAKGVLLPDGTAANQQMPTAPDVTVNGLIRYSWDTSIGTAALQVDASYQDKVIYTVVNHPSAAADSYVLANFRASLEMGAWEIAGYVRNISDKRYQTYSLDLSAFNSFTQTQWGPPRWWGLEVRYGF